MVANRVLVVVRSGEMTRLFQHAIEAGENVRPVGTARALRGRYAVRLKVARG